MTKFRQGLDALSMRSEYHSALVLDVQDESDLRNLLKKAISLENVSKNDICHC
jgi:hypothetical protein